MFFHALLSLGRKFKANGEDGHALTFLQALQLEEVPPSIREAAQQELDALIGRGSSGMRLEYLAGRFLRDATSYKIIMPMLLGSMTFNIVRAVSLPRLTGLVPAGRGLASLTGFAAEVAAFTFSSRFFHRLSGDALRETVGEDLKSTGITLGFLKLFGLVGRHTFHRLHQVSDLCTVTRYARLANSTRQIFSQGAQFLGLMTASHVGQKLELNAPADRATKVTDALASLISLGVGGHLGHQVLGRGFAAFQKEAELRASALNPPVFPESRGHGLGSPAFVLRSSAAKQEGRETTVAWAKGALMDPNSMSVGDGSPSGGLKLNRGIVPSGKIDNGPLGIFSREIIAGVPVYSPLQPPGESFSLFSPLEAMNKGLVLLISGIRSNHTAYAELPSRLAKNGWTVKNLVIPGFDFDQPVENLAVRNLGASRLEKNWDLSLKAGVRELMDQYPGLPVFLGGFSLGGAAVTRIMEAMPPSELSRVKGVLLAAPAYAVKALDSSNPIKNWIIRHIALPLLTFLFPKPQKARTPRLAPELAKFIQLKEKKTFGHELAAVKFTENTLVALKRLQKQHDLPPVLLFYDKKDPTVSPRSVPIAAETFGNAMRVIELEDTDHYIFSFSGREKVHLETMGFLEGLRKNRQDLKTPPSKFSAVFSNFHLSVPIEGPLESGDARDIS